MCSRARLRSVSMSERKAPRPGWASAIELLPAVAVQVAVRRVVAVGAGRARARRAVTLRVGLRVLRLDVGLLFVVLRFRLLLAVAHAILVRLALLLGHFVLAFGLGLVDLAGVAVGRLVLLPELGLGDFLVRLGFGLADVLRVAFHAAAL